MTATDRSLAADTWGDLASRFVALKRDVETEMAPAPMVNRASVYTDAPHFERELEVLFRGMPVPIGLSADLRRPGDYLSGTVGGVLLFVVRDNDGQLGGFVNACRHRGTRLVDRSGHLHSAIRCPYHSWTFDFRGAFRTAPFSSNGFAGFPLEDVSLARLPAFERHGLVYVGATPRADDTAAIDDLDLLTDDFAALDLGRFHFFREETSTWPMNWKFAMDSFLETYHVFSLHRQSVAPSFLAAPLLFDRFGWNLRMCSWRRHAPDAVEALAGNERFRTSANLFYILFPNSVINLPVTGHAELWQILPDGPESVRVVTRFYTPEPVTSPKGMGFWNKNFELSRDVVLVEDFPLQVTVHQSLMSGGTEQLLYGANEPGLIAFHQLLAERLGTSHG